MLIVGIFEFLLKQFSIVEGFRRARCCGFVKPYRRCNRVPMLRDAFACGVLTLATGRS